MSFRKPLGNLPQKALSAVAAISLAAAGLALLSTATEAAPAGGRPAKNGYSRRAGQPGAVHPDPA